MAGADPHRNGYAAAMAPTDGTLPLLSRARREGLLDLPGTEEAHADVLEELGFADVVESRSPPSALRPEAIRVAAWNAERGRSLDGAARLLQTIDADVVLLSEMDHGCARSGNLHTTRELADRLGFGYAFAVEFLELGLGDASETEQNTGKHNVVGYHGGGLLTRLPFEELRVVRLESRGSWFSEGGEQRRVGGRIAVLARLAGASGPIALASVHLESHSNPADRSEQLATVAEALEVFAPGLPAVIGGDLNTSSLGGPEIRDREVRRRAIEADPSRLADPVPYEPLFSMAHAAGYHWQACNVGGEPTHRVNRNGKTTRTQLHLDWLLARNLACSEPRVVEALDPEDQGALSDHDVVVATFRPV